MTVEYLEKQEPYQDYEWLRDYDDVDPVATVLWLLLIVTGVAVSILITLQTTGVIGW